MNFKKSILVSIVIGLSMPVGMLAVDTAEITGAASLVHINKNNVCKAEQEYRNELQYAAPIQWGVGLSVAALVGLGVYKYYWRTANPSVKDLFVMCHEQQEAIAKLQKEVARLANNKQLEAPVHSWAYRFAASSWDMGMMLINGGALSLGSSILISPVVNKVLDVKNSLPNRGDLQWYITNRVKDYETNFSALIRCPKYNVFRATFNLTLASWVHNIEHVVGYINYFATTLEASEPLAARLCKQHAHDIEVLTNQLVDNAHESLDLALLIDQVGELHAMVTGAQSFIAPRYR